MEKYQTEKEVEDYIKQMVDNGFIKEDGTPLKCQCGCTDFEQSGEYWEEHTIIEYALNCKTCGERVGYWAYGYWDILG